MSIINYFSSLKTKIRFIFAALSFVLFFTLTFIQLNADVDFTPDKSETKSSSSAPASSRTTR